MRTRLLRNDDPRVTRYVPLCKRIARSYSRVFAPVLDTEDLFTMALLEVWKAVGDWRAERGLNLTSYVERRIHGKLRNVMVRYGLRVQKNRPRNMKRYPYMGEFSFDQMIANDPVEDRTYADIVADTKLAVDPLDRIQVRRYAQVLRRAMRVLTSREQYVLQKRFMYDETLLEIGKALGVSRQRIEQVEKKAITKLRSVMKEQVDFSP